ncbi:MAG: holo-ACP synthase [Candidatus Krumholzibacteria bacterium]|nr:holo-ACP synthase [Candidatus Krumholzibacteria bacterium]
MIVGVGIDTVSIARMEKLIRARGERFLLRVFSEIEIGEGMKRARNAPFFAARFAAREAFVKALGTGFARGVSFRDITVGKGDRGRPELSFSARVETLLKARGIERCHVSITHDGDCAQAIVILEGA